MSMLNDLADGVNADWRAEAAAAASYDDVDPAEGYDPADEEARCGCCSVVVEPGEGCWHDHSDVYCDECAPPCSDCEDEAAERAAESYADSLRERGILS